MHALKRLRWLGVEVSFDVGVGVDGVGDVDLVVQSLTTHRAPRPSKRSDRVHVAVALNVAVYVNLNATSASTSGVKPISRTFKRFGVPTC